MLGGWHGERRYVSISALSIHYSFIILVAVHRCDCVPVVAGDCITNQFVIIGTLSRKVVLLNVKSSELLMSLFSQW